MPCSNLQIYWLGKNGQMVFKRSESIAPWAPRLKPCGKCLGCKLDYARMWALRGILELQLHTKSCFITLTYDNEHLPPAKSLHKPDVQKFWKSLRKKIAPVKLRYLECGEYGEKNGRPHYHAIVFGWQPNDLVYHSTRRGIPNYTSATVFDCWKRGHIVVGAVSYNSIAYVARYILKKQVGVGAEEFYGVRRPEYFHMSNKPGIAHDWIAKYNSSVYPEDKVYFFKKGKLTYQKPPRYFDKYMEEVYYDMIYEVKEKRQAKAPSLDEWAKLFADRLRLGKVQEYRQSRISRPIEEGDYESPSVCDF
ncbi:replication initiator protein [Chicken microvirus mg7_14]|nr:replication initiator protein [Chicken microvirus mg7_14]